MNRSWMYGDRWQRAYLDGVLEFCNSAVEYREKAKEKLIFCPCRDCDNIKRWGDIKIIEDHLLTVGFTSDYHVWYYHGEKGGLMDTNELHPNDQVFEDVNNNDDELIEAPQNEMEDMLGAMGDHDNDQPKILDDLKKAAETPVSSSSKYSKLSATLTLTNIKSKCGWTNESFDWLLEVLRDMFSADLPKSTYFANKLMNPLGLGYTKIDACRNDCILFRKEYENLQSCPICGESRYKREGASPDPTKWPPAKVLWYLPIIPRFRRLFSVKKDAKNLVWHDEERKKDGLIRHPADGEQWKNIDKEFPAFSRDPRNLRLGLSCDGMNPYGTLNSTHSTWPVLLTIYNLPPWLCMKRKYIMLSLLISGPRQPGHDIDVYLAPLIDDLKILWHEGVPMFDAHTNTNFTLKAMLFCTINDYPAYGNLSGYKVRSEKGCPICEEDLPKKYLKCWGKNVFMHTRRHLPRYHPYRRMKSQFNGKTEHGIARDPLTGIQVYDRIKNVNTHFGKLNAPSSKKGELWKKVSILWDLPYWKHLAVRHCLDVMHIEKNVCDSLVGTLLDTPGKTKDGYSVRNDMKMDNIRPKLWPEHNADGSKAYLPRACYTLSRDEKRRFCECLYGIKVPTGYSSNVRHLVSMGDKRLIGMKSHDCHVLMQVFLPIALRGLMSKHVRHAILRLCLFFNKICKKVLDPKELDTLQHELIETLCKFEMYFPPSFFDIMVHLVMHIVREVKECGPVFLRWMYPFERYMGFLKDLARNPSKPEGSIIKNYTAQECSNHCAVFLAMGQEIGLGKSRHEGRLEGYGTVGHKQVKPPSDRFHKAHRYVLQHLSEVHPYVEKHLAYLKSKHQRYNPFLIMQEHNRTFAEWFQNQVYLEMNDPNSNVSDTLACLARGPQSIVSSFQGYDINGYCFSTKFQDEKGVHQNSGVTVIASSTEYSSSKDSRPIDATQSYYGVIEEIWELDYLDFKVPLFRCKWVDNRRGCKISEEGMTLVDSTRFSDTHEPFVLASQAKQVFYVVDNVDQQWRVVVQGKRKIVGVDEVDDEEEYDKFDDTPPVYSVVEPLGDGEDVDDEVYDREEGNVVDVPKRS